MPSLSALQPPRMAIHTYFMGELGEEGPGGEQPGVYELQPLLP